MIVNLVGPKINVHTLIDREHFPNTWAYALLLTLTTEYSDKRERKHVFLMHDRMYTKAKVYKQKIYK